MSFFRCRALGAEIDFQDDYYRLTQDGKIKVFDTMIDAGLEAERAKG